MILSGRYLATKGTSPWSYSNTIAQNYLLGIYAIYRNGNICLTQPLIQLELLFCTI